MSSSNVIREKPVIIIDTREQAPYLFKNCDFPTEIGTLHTGDYSIKGYEDVFAIERKTLVDFTSCITSGRERFEREVERLSQLQFGAVIIETDCAAIWKAPLISKISRKVILNTAFKWSLKYDIPFQFVTNRTGGAYAVTNWIEAFLMYRIYPLHYDNRKKEIIKPVPE